MKSRHRNPGNRESALREEALQPGVTVASVGDKHGISHGFLSLDGEGAGRFFSWCDLNGIVHATFCSGPVGAAGCIAGDHLPVLPLPPRTGSGAVEIVFGNGRVLKVRESIDPAVLGNRRPTIAARKLGSSNEKCRRVACITPAAARSTSPSRPATWWRPMASPGSMGRHPLRGPRAGGRPIPHLSKAPAEDWFSSRLN